MNMVSVRGRKNYEVLQKEIERDKLLVEASQNGESSLLNQLLAEGASPDAAEFNRSLFYASKNYITPLQFAASAGYTECVEILIKHGGLFQLSHDWYISLSRRCQTHAVKWCWPSLHISYFLAYKKDS